MLSGKKARKSLGKVAKVGGVAALGALAYAGYRRYRDGQQAAAPEGGGTIARSPAAEASTRATFMPSNTEPRRRDRMAGDLVEAMISAARADGTLDEREMTRIRERMAELGLNAEERAYLLDRLSQPADPARIANLARNEAEAAELYMASLLAIDVDHWAEQAYLRELGDRLRLEERLRQELEAGAKAHLTGEGELGEPAARPGAPPGEAHLARPAGAPG